jgi:hypothetical protein
MAATTSRTKTSTPDLEAATERAREANERMIEASRKVSNAYLDGIEKYVAGLSRIERKFAEQSKVEAVASMLGAHADLTEEMTKVSVSAARGMIAA